MSWKSQIALMVVGSALATAQVVLIPEGMKKEAEALVPANPKLKLLFHGKGADAASQIGEAEAYVGPLNEALLEKGVKLKWVHNSSAGVEGAVGLPGIRDGKVMLTNLKIYQGPEIADHAFALLLGLTRNMAAYHKAQETGDWIKSSREGLPLTELRGKTMLVIGYGGIGTQVAERARAFGMKVMAIDEKDIPLTVTVDRFGKPDELDDMLPLADVITSCVPITPETDKMIGEAQFAKMKKGAYLINVSRGKVVDTEYLIKALQSGQVGAAGLDVVDPEPLPSESPLWKMPNVIITPHIAGVSDARAGRSNELIIGNIERFSKGQPLKNVVDVAKGY
jgi:phosphoglycerate dehydrogenase-like enzyme